MTIQSLRLFVAVSNEKSFSAAGRKLFITPSAVIQQMIKLEKEVGFLLFVRNHRGLSLTEEGEVFYKGVISILSQLDTTLEACKQTVAQHKNIIRIGVHTSSLMSAYEAYEQEFPNCTCSYSIFQETDVDQIFQKFLENELDVIEWPIPEHLKKQGIGFLPRYSAELCCLMSRNHPFSVRSSLSLQDLSSQKVLVYSHKNQEIIEEALSFQLSQLGIQNFHYKSIKGESNAIIEACREGGIVLVSKAYAKSIPLKTVNITPAIFIKFGLAYKEKGNKQTHQLIQFIAKFDQSNGVEY